MTKKEMRNALLRKPGIGVKVTTISNEVFFFFFEDVETHDGEVHNGIDKARKHFRYGEHLVFYTCKWAQQNEFKDYLTHYYELCKIREDYPDNAFVQEKFEAYEESLVELLQMYTGFSERKARGQILKNSISFNKFTGKVVAR